MDYVQHLEATSRSGGLSLLHQEVFGGLVDIAAFEADVRALHSQAVEDGLAVRPVEDYLDWDLWIFAHDRERLEVSQGLGH